MKALRFLPIVFLVGVHGFVFFAPYIALVLTAGYTARKLRRDAPRPQPVRARSFPFFRRRAAADHSLMR